MSRTATESDATRGLDESNEALEIELSLRRRLSDALLQANRELERLVGARSDELRLALASLESQRERERERLARDLHDDLGHLLSCLRLELDIVESGTPGVDLDACHGLLDRVIASTRTIVAGLRPEALESRPLSQALRELVRETGERYHLSARAEIDPGVDRFDAPTSTAVYRIVQEAINNVLKHARAKSLEVVAESRPDWMDIRIVDDGVGIGKRAPRDGFGLMGMRERIMQLGGGFEVESAAEAGTRITVSLPVTDYSKIRKSKP